MKYRFIARILVISPFLFGFIEKEGWAEANVCSASYITDLVRGEGTIDQFGQNFQTINIYSYQFNGQCRVVAKSPWEEQMAHRLKDDHNRLVLINLVNEIDPTPGPCRDLSPGQVVDRLLSDPNQQADLIRQIVAIGALAQGIEIDFEHVLSQTTTNFTQFMQALRAALPPEKKLAAVVQPKTLHGGEQGTTIDWRGIEPYVDYIRVMAYYYSWNTSPPGPVITYSKLGQVADYILNDPNQSIPPQKARIMISLYGWDWPISPASPGKLIEFKDAVAIAQAHGITPQRDPTEDTLHFQYVDNGVKHEVWFEDVVGDQKRIQLLLDRNFPAIDIWHLNTGDPTLWQWFKPKIRTDCPSLAGSPSPPANARLDKIDPPTIKVLNPDTPFTLSGSGFSSSDVVLWSGNPYYPTSVTSGSSHILVSSSDLSIPVASRVYVTQNGHISNSADFYVVGNPIINSFDPPGIAAGSNSFQITLIGDGFEPGSYVRWDNQTIGTHFLNGQQIKGDVNAEFLSVPAMVHIGVVNPTSGSRVSRVFEIGSGQNNQNQAGINGFRVGPNPWKSSLGEEKIRFYGISSDDGVKIFTLAGQFVRNLQPLNGTAEWDLTNDSGERVASGFYLYLATDSDNSKKSGTIAVIR